jgi:hypothetical protein
MKTNVPFYKQTKPLNCGPVSLKMAFSFFGKDMLLEEIEEKCRIKEGKAGSTVHLAICAVELGFKIKLFSKSLTPIMENLDLDYVKKNSEDNYIETVNKMIKELKDKNAELTEKSISPEELLSYVSETSVPIVLVDWNVIFPRYGGYYGHFVPLVGYDDENVYIHNPGLMDAAAFMKINKELFDKARKSKGTDEDVLIIFR